MLKIKNVILEISFRNDILLCNIIAVRRKFAKTAIIN